MSPQPPTRSRLRRLLCLTSLALAASANLPASVHASPTVQFEVQLGGGTALDFGSGSVGNLFAGGAAINVGDFSLGLSVATVLPDSRVQGQFAATWLDSRWYLLGRQTLFSPYIGFGVGLSFADHFDQDDWNKETGGNTAPERWATAGPAPLLMPVVGLRFGRIEGMSLSVDLRLYNTSHGGLNAVVAYAF